MPYLDHDWRVEANTGIDLGALKEVANKITTVPDGIVVQRQVAKIYDDRRKMAGGALPLNWGMAELLAYGTLLKEGFPIRFTGQDVRRGTFSHRHAVIFNQKDGDAYLPLVNMYDEQPRFDIYDSVLSEEAVLAFEYGYATTAPKGLIIWEAQFGDFANGAQVVIDQFIASGEHKWGRLCGLTMMLPHGFEGQDQSIRQPVWSVSCNSAPSGTCRYVIPPRRRKFFICCVVRRSDPCVVH